MEKQKLEIAKVIREKNQTVKKNLGCFFLPFKAILVLLVIVFVIADLFGLMSGISFGLLLGLVFMELILVLMGLGIVAGLEHLIRSRHTLSPKTEFVLVEVKLAKILQTYTKTYKNYVPNVREFETECYFKLLADGGIVDLMVNIQTYKSYNKDDEIYVFKINGEYDRKYIFDPNKYYLDSSGMEALKNPIKIYI